MVKYDAIIIIHRAEYITSSYRLKMQTINHLVTMAGNMLELALTAKFAATADISWLCQTELNDGTL